MYREEWEGNSSKRRRRRRCSSRRRWRRPRLCRRPPTVGGTIGSLLVCQQLYFCTKPHYIFLPLKEHPETSCRKVLFILTVMDSSSVKRFRGHVFTSSGLFYANITLPAVALSGLPTPSITGLFENPRSGSAFFFPWNWDLELKLISAALSARLSHSVCLPYHARAVPL